MAASYTVYPFRQALTLSLHQLILAHAVPAVNANLSFLMAAQGFPSARIPQLSGDSVVMGDLSPIKQVTLCILEGTEDNQRIASEGLFYTTLTTQIQVKTPRIGDNSPEDFSMLAGVVSDNLRDLFTSQPLATITPRNASGGNLLPAGMAFQDCFWLGARALNFPNREEDSVTYTRGLIGMHTASIAYFQNRTLALGTG